ncbi:Indole-3-acetaldehyde oxidase [Pseudolycoriella hygida]|uniref:Indole-3-acetaldehyde oxidase n=1 Tax=Pseudolycoriella hygida TaxID=35572 RepID=A0A9Q0N1Z2_9DIPT|nr:Indole-3-acetaldehyde oxidase [Pseudolycoriella hygida]
MSVTFSINGTLYEVDSSVVPLDTNLNTFIRTNAELSGTKFMCSEGGCGACIVNVNAIHPVTKESKSWAVNSCLTPVFSCHGYDITTVEGIGNQANGFHKIQQRLAYLNGTQCGYCTPGMVMNMYSLLESKNGKVSMEEVENSFGGNICRCTGYRPILDAFKSFAYDADKKLIEACRDIEDLTKTCPKTGSPCAGLCSKNPEAMNISFVDNKQWYQITDLAQLFQIFENIKDTPYMLVAGNTAHGVYRRNENIDVFIDITRVAALQTHSIGTSVTLGGNVSLTETMEVLKKASMRSGFHYLKHFVDHIDLIANVPVRNSGTIAGNLSIKHQHIEFPSDVFIILEAVGAKLTIAESNSTQSVVSVTDYLSLEMTGKIILNVILPALDQREFTFRSYKIMPRAQNAHAYVNAAFLLKMSGGKVSSARICFGGISPTFIHATSTENLLIGKDIHTNDVLKDALTCLSSELNPDWILPDASPEYRRELAVALFYKFVISTCPSYIVKPEYVSGAGILKRPISSGRQEYDSFKSRYPLTENVPKYEGLVQCSGELEYINDFPPMKNELWAAFVQATEVHTTVESVDLSDAFSIPGVRHYFCAKDIPGVNDFMPKSIVGGIGSNAVEEIFLGDNSPVLYNGQPIGVILADSFTLANRAAKKVKITYKLEEDAKPIITTLHDAHELNAVDRYKPMPFCKLTATNTDNDTSNAKKVVGSFDIGSQYHYTMEPQTTICRPSEDGIVVMSATQWVDITQVAVANCLNITSNKVNMVHRRIGGGYGAKSTRAGQVACASALACKLTNRPVRFVLTMEANMETVGKRIGLINEYDIDVDEEGKIVKMSNVFSQDFGCSFNENVMFSTLGHMKNCYATDTWTVSSKMVHTNSPSHTYCRAPGSTEGVAMIENIMEHISRVTGKDPLSVRLANIPAEHKMRTILTDFIHDTDFYARKTEIDEFNLKNRWRKRGISIVPMDYHQPFFGMYPVSVTIYHDDGSVAISHGGIEMGQGINTKAAQVAAHLLQIPLSSVSIRRMDNVTGANGFVSAISIASESICMGVKKACKELLERMKPVRDELNNPEWKQLVRESHRRNVDLSCRSVCRKGDIPEYSIYGCSCAEVEIDLLSGNVQLRRVDVLEDTGESMSPGIDIGQVEGSFVMGIGYWLTESVIYGKEKGELLTNRTWTYKPPGVKDIPVDFRIKFLKNSSNTTGVFRSKATGEPPLCMAVVVIFALRHALESARKDAGLSDEWFNLGAPSTPDILFMKAGNSIEDYKL